MSVFYERATRAETSESWIVNHDVAAESVHLNKGIELEQEVLKS